jgi:polyhydroxybutyrate depolymerase
MRLVVVVAGLLLFCFSLVQADERTYHLYIPSDHHNTLVVALHGRFSSGRALEAQTGLNGLAEEYGFMVVYPDAADAFWEDGAREAGLTRFFDPSDDTAFLRDLIDELTETHAIEEVMLVGYDNGGQMAFHLTCAMPERFSKVVVVSALLWTFHRDHCAEGVDTDMLLIHGTGDRWYPLNGLTVPDVEAEMLSLEATVAFWTEKLDEPSRFRQVVIEGGQHHWYRTGEYHLNQIGLDLTQIVADFLMDQPPQPGAELDVPALQRTYLYYVPPQYDADEPMPLVIGLHGRPDTGAGFAAMTEFHKIAQKEGFIVAFPDNIDSWDALGGVTDFDANPVDDVGFITDLIHDLSIDLNIDSKRVYVVGFSNGGFMAHSLACQIPEQFAAVAAVGALMLVDIIESCEFAAPVPMLIMHGTDDLSVPWAGLTGRDALGNKVQHGLSAPDTLNYWVYHNGCETEGEVTEYPELGNSPGTSAARVDYTGCKENADVTFVLIRGGGHNWVGLPGRIPPEVEGQVNQDINAGEVIWSFFEQHTR